MAGGVDSQLLDRSVAARARRRMRHLAHRSMALMPPIVSRRITRDRHLRHVTANMAQLTDPALLGTAPIDSVTWIEQARSRPPIPPGIDFETLDESSRSEVVRWMTEFSWDKDEQLDGRMDNNGDEVGRARAALRTRMRLTAVPDESSTRLGARVAFDARSLQSAAFGTRGIGRFARAALLSTRAAKGDDGITLIVDRALHPLPAELAGTCEQVTRIGDERAREFAGLISPSPMTHSPDPITPLLLGQARSIAIVFDFIPLHFPTVYIPHVAARVEYAANLDALRMYDEFICISHLVQDELSTLLERELEFTTVAWPQDVTVRETIQESAQGDTSGPIVLMTGDDARKNTFGGLAGIAAATSAMLKRDVAVVGMAGQDTRVHHWSIAAAMRPGEAMTLDRLTDEELSALLSSASCVVVPSFDEGLSLPVIEALSAGAPVVASDIPAHRELIGSGQFSCVPGEPRSICEAIERVRGKQRIAWEQRRRLLAHKHEVLEDVIVHRINRIAFGDSPAPKTTPAEAPSRLSIGIATPWNPQRTGVADYSVAVFEALAELADVTIYSTSGAHVPERTATGTAIRSHDIEELFESPELASQRHDTFITVVGNSHYHLPYVDLLRSVDAIVIAHDTRMIEYYMALRGKGGVAHLMTMTADPDAPRGIDPALEDQIDDMRLLQNAGFWEIAQRSRRLALHSPSAAPRIEVETGRRVHVLPFANYRSPDIGAITEEQRAHARTALGLDAYPEGTIHLASFGYVDIRTKLNDLVVEAAAWLSQWGYSVALHFVGSASDSEERALVNRAAKAGLAGFQITGFQPEDRFRQWLMGIDLGIQLRISPLLGVSGPLSDLAAYGTPAIASRGLCVDVDPPEFIRPLPDAVSPVMVAEAVEEALASPMSAAQREGLRQGYLAEKSPSNYAKALLAMLKDSA